MNRELLRLAFAALAAHRLRTALSMLDRKSTRLNSSHGYISYAVFCLKKKKEKTHRSHSPGFLRYSFLCPARATRSWKPAAAPSPTTQEASDSHGATLSRRRITLVRIA